MIALCLPRGNHRSILIFYVVKESIMPGEPRVIAIAEPKWSEGHFATQMQIFLSILLEEGHCVIVLCPAPDQVMAWLDENWSAHRHLVYAAYFSLDGSTLAAQAKKGTIRNYVTGLLRAAENSTGWQVDMVFITWLDILVDGVGRALWFRHNLAFPWTGLYFLPTFLRTPAKGMKWAAHWLSVRILFNSPGFRSIAVLDEGVQSTLAGAAHGKQVFLFPDATDEALPQVEPAQIGAIRQKAGGRPIIGLLGVLERRKGLLTFLRAVAGIEPQACYCLVAGHLPWDIYSDAEQREIRELMASCGNRMHFEPGFIEDPAEFNAYVSACDFLYMVYDEFYHSSGILTKAAVFEKPVIVHAGSCMEERVQRCRMGLVAPAGDITRVRAAILQLAGEEFRRQIKEQAQFEEYHQFHNREQVKRVLAEMLELRGNQTHIKGMGK